MGTRVTRRLEPYAGASPLPSITARDTVNNDHNYDYDTIKYNITMGTRTVQYPCF